MAKLRVLVAEDESIIRLDLCTMLERAGFEVCAQARDGLAAVELARAHAPDVAILDVKMQPVDGLEAARQILAERMLPIVMLTAYGDESLVERAIEIGVFGYVVKPFREQDLLPAVRTAIARHRDFVEGTLPEAPLSVDVPASGGGSWPLRIVRRVDGRLDVAAREEA
jgi:AmiR/NasT family two-component response regulator